jgi:hypothetical protein
MESGVSRRGILELTLVAAASVAQALASPARAQPELSEAQKISHADAKYQTTPDGQQRCEICLQFEPPDHCKIVQGPITPQGWCQYFAARENAH